MSLLAEQRRIISLTLIPVGFLLLLMTAGCNTIRGAGEDVQAAGEAVSGGAESTEEKLEDATQ